MRDVNIKRSDTVVWDIIDPDYGILTQATFKPLPRSDHMGFHVSFNGDYAGLDHVWTHPGDDIPAFLRRIDFEYTMNKLLGERFNDVYDVDAMNDDYFEWLNATFEDVDGGWEFIEEVESVIEMYHLGNEFGARTAYEIMSVYIEHVAETENSVIWDMGEYYDEVIGSFKDENRYKKTYLHFWNTIWPLYIDAVTKYLHTTDQH